MVHPQNSISQTINASYHSTTTPIIATFISKENDLECYTMRIPYFRYNSQAISKDSTILSLGLLPLLILFSSINQFLSFMYGTRRYQGPNQWLCSPNLGTFVVCKELLIPFFKSRLKLLAIGEVMKSSIVI